MTKRLIKILSIILIGVILLSAALFALYKTKGSDNYDNYDLSIYFFDAGKADAILISKDDKYIMIDTGESSLGNEILQYFNKHNITRLEYLIITHFDKDHVGSASTIIDNIEIGEVLQSNSPKDSEFYTAYLNSLSNKSITATTISGTRSLAFSDINVSVNGPEDLYEKDESNNSSLIVSFSYADKSFLFMGDSENQRIKDFIASNNQTYDFIKIPYHGNYLKQLDNLLEATSPSYGVITCSAQEGGEDETLDVLNDFKVKYFKTNNGPITVFSDGKEIKIRQ